ncbi:MULTISPECIES: hypothetical protein [Sphingobacterium]|jgi:hypothetical protein|uniref:Uncharacterized protein n=2 Tax=Sphingobacterium TaxID=28453 RepID=A0ABW5YUL3_9SPHI|nr:MULTISPECIES: hypothetical protein [Sphingobacterium]KKX50531.1 hypothetical protein L950_0209965 [Sphingobacterium sp. IITKGP-BTPF85]MBB2950444.1 hypothetical protein [Sphingobacterium sp. JUb56]MCS3552954.1 hypothetical protein [Sphingobacterium sp. JUb21]MCW2258975.1 hypothetical protein [Sphingobacterium kitahiroshimense]NJI72929.1 hypothetical protein [Sphingobacterium sp. B16(2022)]
MRILAELPHPDCKISIFGMNQKFIIKFEQGTLEQSYKIAETDIVGGVNGVFELLDETFIAEVLNHFSIMRKSFIVAFDRYDS